MKRALPIVATLMGLALTMGCGPGEAPSARASNVPPASTVPLAVAAADDVDTFVRVPGTVEPVVRTSPGTKILGRVSRVPAQEGTRVQRGDLLVQLEDADLRAAVQQAEAAVGMAQAQRDNAEAQHRRIVELRARKSATDKNLEDAVAGLRIADAALRQAEAAVASAEVMLGYAAVRSPIDGWVSARRVEVGDMVAPGAPLFTLEDLSRAKILVQVPESQVIGMERGDPAVIELDALDRELSASIDRVLPAGDPASRTYEVKLLVDNAEGALRSGMFVRVRFPRGTEPSLRVPEEAVVSRGQLRGLFVLDDEGTARLRWVRLGRTADGRVEVLSGLEPGERYVAAPPAGFADATPVVGG